MPAFVTLRNLSCPAPDGTPLLQDLDLSFGAERTGLIGRNGAGKSTLLRLLAGEIAPLSGSIAREGRIGTLRQTLLADPAETIAHAFGATEGLARIERLSDGRGTPEDAAEADWTLHARIAEALDQAGLAGLDPARRLATLSGGQRMRAALASLAFRRPDLILLDEPTNDLDREGRAAVARLLAGWRGGAVVVSHDRELLRGMDRILEVSTLGARLYGGNWDHYVECRELEKEAAGRRLATAERRVKEIDAKAQAARERKARRDGKGARDRARGGQAKILLDAAKETSERSAARTDILAQRMRREAAEAAEAARAEVERLKELKVALAPTGLASGRLVLAFRDVSGGPGARPAVEGLSFTLTGPERVAVTGPNGSGKTTLLRLAAGELAPEAGEIRRPVRAAMLDQQVALLKPELSVAENFRRLNPGAGENACRAALARFLFRAEAALRPAGTLSGGEMLRAGLACVLGGAQPPGLLLLDEPTNHLDLASIAAVEAGLAAYDGALLVASHDEDFLKAIGASRRIAL